MGVPGGHHCPQHILIPLLADLAMNHPELGNSFLNECLRLIQVAVGLKLELTVTSPSHLGQHFSTESLIAMQRQESSHGHHL